MITLLLSLTSCLNPQSEAPRLLEQAQNLMESRPDSAMLLIDSIFYPEESLSKQTYMDYLVTRVQARYKNYRPIAEDTLVFAARDYFAQNNRDPKQTTLAYFYSGCVYREQGNFELAMQHYKDAERYVAQAHDADLKGLVQYNMGDLLAEEDLDAQALEAYKKAEGYYSQSPTNPQSKQARCLADIGRMYLMQEKEDSAFIYFHKGLELAKTAGNNTLQSLLAQNLSMAYKEAGQYDEAKTYLHQSFQLNADTTRFARYYLNYSKLYMATQQFDSVRYYKEKLIQSIDASDDPFFKASTYNLLAQDAKRNNDYATAFDYQQKRISAVEKIYEKRARQSVYEVQQKYDYEMVQNQHVKLINRYQKWGIILLITLLAGGTVFTFYTIGQKNLLLETRENIETLRQMAAGMAKSYEANIEQKESDLRELLLWKFDVIKKSALLSAGDREHKNTSRLVKQFHKIVYDESADNEWENILSVFNRVNGHISESVKRQYPHLTETEYRICLLSYAGMSVKEIAVILQVSPNTVQTYRTALRKKLGIEKPSVDLTLFLKNTL